MRLANNTNHYRALFYGLLCIFDLEYPALRRTSSWDSQSAFRLGSMHISSSHSQGYGIVIVVVPEHDGRYSPKLLDDEGIV